MKEDKERQNSGETPIVALSGFSSGWRWEGTMQTGWDWGKKGNIDGRREVGGSSSSFSFQQRRENLKVVYNLNRLKGFVPLKVKFLRTCEVNTGDTLRKP